MGLFDFFRKLRKQEETKEQPPKEEKIEQNDLEALINKYRVKCDFTVQQQREWLRVLNKTIDTIMLGETPISMDYELTPSKLAEAGNMLNTVGRIAIGVGIMLSITNMEKALNTDSFEDLVRTYCILDTYSEMLLGPYRGKINAGKMYIYDVLKKTDRSKPAKVAPAQDTPENKLYWAPAIYDGDPLVLAAPDYEIHVFPGAAQLIEQGMKYGPIPAGYGFATKPSGRAMHLRLVRNPASGVEMVPLFTDINMLLRIFSPNTRVSLVDYQTACRFCLQDKNRCAGIIIDPGKENKIIPVDQIRVPNVATASAPEPKKENTATAPVSEPAQVQTKEKYTYYVSSVSTKDRWVFIECNEEDATWDSEPFTELVRKAAGVVNDGVWEGNILPAGVFQGDTRYRIKNDPLLMVFQYDTLFGIVLEYTPAIGLGNALNYLSNMLDVEVDDKFRP